MKHEKRRAFNIAYVNAELRAMKSLKKFEKEFIENAEGKNTVNQNNGGNDANGGAPNNADRNVPQPVGVGVGGAEPAIPIQ